MERRRERSEDRRGEEEMKWEMERKGVIATDDSSALTEWCTPLISCLGVRRAGGPLESPPLSQSLVCISL